jgi:lipopolysaccharide transport system ATP-binding protein
MCSEAVIDTPVHTTMSEASAVDDVMIRVENVGKRYRIYERPQDRLKQMLLWRLGRSYGHDFWALRGVSFEVRRGETLGVIGRNGSGKSTLLQIIAGTLAPNEGNVQVHGRVAALLELGSGFNPEFTGRENVYLNGAIIGLSREEVDARFDEITAFADIGEFLDQPVKLYSSGMVVRLAFAVQACIEPDVLIVDEALAVGDVFFQQKCYQRLEVLRDRGTAIIVVTHAVGEIEQFCRRALVLHRGAPIFFGSAAEAVARYYLVDQQEREQPLSIAPGSAPTEAFRHSHAATYAADAFFDLSVVPQVGEGAARCVGVALCDHNGRACRAFGQGEVASFFYIFELLEDINVPIGAVEMHNEKGVNVHGKNSLQYDVQLPARGQRGQLLHFRQDIRLDVAGGEYTFDVGLASITHADFVQRAVFSVVELYGRVRRICHLTRVGSFAVIYRNDHGRVVQAMHHGVADLAGNHHFFAASAVGKTASGT